MKSLEEVIVILRQHKAELAKKYPIKSLAVFGSYARNEQHIESDLDLIVEFNDKIGIRFIDLAEELESLIGFRIDLVSRKGVKERYFDEIKSEMIYV